MKILLHVGVPKSGTTTLQFSLFANHTKIQYLGKPYNTRRGEVNEDYATAELCDYIYQVCGLTYDKLHAASLFNAGVAPRLVEGKLNTLSEEAFAGAGAVDRKIIAERLKELFGPAKILITLREQKKALLSLYRYFYTRLILSGSPDDWIRHLDSFSYYYARVEDFPLRNYKYTRLYEEYMSLFGRENVLVLPLEMLQSSPDVFADRFSWFCGIDRDECLKLLKSAPKHNVSPGALGMKYQRLLKRYYKVLRRFGREVDIRPWGIFEEGIHGRVMNTLARISPAPAGFSSGTMDVLNGYYGADNEKLARISGLDLAGFGYHIPE